MRALVILSVSVLLGLALSGCAVVEAGGAVIGAGASVVGTAVDVAGDAVGAVTGDSDKDKKK